MRESWRTKPIHAGTEAVAHAGRADVRAPTIRVLPWSVDRVVAVLALEVDATIVPSLRELPAHWGVEGAGCPFALVDPNDFAGRVLTQGDGKTLTWRVLECRTIWGRPILVEYVEADNVGREGIAGKYALIEQTIEKLVSRALRAQLLATVLSNISFIP
nr:hypothetical protein GCM10025699_56520 [Microbacterium flavescens]